MKKYETLASEIVDKNPYWEYKKDKYSLPNGKEYDYFYVHSLGSVIIIAKFENKFILGNQYRYLNQRNSVEFPGGGVVAGLSILENAKKEFLEETGFIAESFKIIGKFNPYIGVTDEDCFVILAEGVTNSLEQLGTEITEEIELLLLDENEIEGHIKNELIWNGQTLAAWMIYKNKYGVKND